MGIPSTFYLIPKFPNMSLLILTLSTLISVASAHGGSCKCGTAGMVCDRHQMMFWGMLGVLATYLYMYAGYFWQRYLASFFARWCPCCDEEKNRAQGLARTRPWPRSRSRVLRSRP